MAASAMRPKKEGMYVYNITPNLPPTSSSSSMKSAISKGWGSLTKSKTYREARSEKEKVVAAAREAPERKSVSAVEGNSGAAAVFLQVKVLASDMPGFMQMHAFRCARTTCDTLDKFSSKYMAYNIKKEFDKVYGPAWHCIVGSSFGSFVTHSTGCFLYFSMENIYILVFKTKVERAPPHQL